MITLSSLKSDLDIVLKEMSAYREQMRSILEKIKIVISNDLGHCKRDNCTVDKPCVICKSLRQLDEEIDDLLK